MRYTGVISGHRGPIFYYIAALLIGIFPWIAFLLILGWSALEGTIFTYTLQPTMIPYAQPNGPNARFRNANSS